MSKYKPLDEPITRREACLIIDRKRFDALVRSGRIVPIGKRGEDGVVVNPDDAAVTSPLLFDQQAVREEAIANASESDVRAKQYRTDAKLVAHRKDPLTRRQIATLIGKRLTGILIRSGRLVPSGKLTDTQTAAHTYSAESVRDVLIALADEEAATAQLLRRSSKVRVPA